MKNLLMFNPRKFEEVHTVELGVYEVKKESLSYRTDSGDFEDCEYNKENREKYPDAIYNVFFDDADGEESCLEVWPDDYAKMWLELIEKKYETITDLVYKAYTDSIYSNLNSRHLVIINKSGEVDYRIDSRDKIPNDVQSGAAIIVYNVNGQNISPDYLKYFQYEWGIPDCAEELLARYNNEYKTDFMDVAKVNQENLMYVLHRYFPEWIEEIRSLEIEFWVEDFDIYEALEELFDLMKGEI